MESLARLCLLQLLALGAGAQTVIVVGPGGLPQIRDAVAIATAGDVVVVQPGTYAQFVANVGCTIRAMVPGTVDVRIDPTFLACSPCWFAGMTQLAPPSGQVIHVVGLTFRPDLGTYQGQPVYPGVSVASGTVTFDDCRIGAQGSSTLITPLAVTNATVHLQHCTVEGFPFASAMHTLTAINATVTAIDTVVRTHPGPLGGFGVAISVQNSVLSGSGLQLVGITIEALRVINSQVWLSDSSLATVPVSTCAITVVGQPPQLDRCTSTQPATCSSFPSPTFLLGVSRPAPLQQGTTFTLDYSTEANGIVATVASFGLATATLPTVVQPVWIDQGSALNLGFVLADGRGHATASWAIPAGTAFIDRSLWFQGVSGSNLPLQLSQVTGGVVR